MGGNCRLRMRDVGEGPNTTPYMITAALRIDILDRLPSTIWVTFTGDYPLSPPRAPMDVSHIPNAVYRPLHSCTSGPLQPVLRYDSMNAGPGLTQEFARIQFLTTADRHCLLGTRAALAVKRIYPDSARHIHLS
jgi:hypothetical protein